MRKTRWLRKIQRRDFFGAPSGQEASENLAGCRRALHTFTLTVYEQEGLPSPRQEETWPLLEEQE